MLGDPELLSRRDPDRAPRLKWAAYTSTRFISGAAMGLAAQATLAAVPSEFGELIAATLVGAVIGEALDLFFTALTGRVRGRPIGDAVRTVVPMALASAPVYAPIVALLAFMYVRVSPWTLALFLVPAMAAQRLYGLYQEQRRLADDLSTANETLERANLQFAAALIATLDARDQYTAGHSAAVAIYSRDIAQRMGLAPEIQEHAYLCGLVHDIGKIGLAPGLLEKPGALTLEERRQMQEHSAIGERILAHVDEYSEIARVVRHHHERIDGQGYPDGLVDEAIPLVSRIIGVADAYNAMTSNRPYRDAMPSRVARLRLAQAVDSQFDTAVVAAFEAILAGAAEDYRLAQRRDFREFAQSTYDESAEDEMASVANVA
jgi:putative nucleotidyltransferase with HDIG domain